VTGHILAAMPKPTTTPHPAIEILHFLGGMLVLALGIGAACYALIQVGGWLVRTAYAALRWAGFPHSPALVLAVLAVAFLVGWGVPKALQRLGSRRIL
jgi:hypothetical protein